MRVGEGVVSYSVLTWRTTALSVAVDDPSRTSIVCRISWAPATCLLIHRGHRCRAVLLNPDVNALAFYESLEGTRVLIKRPVVVGPTNNFGETPVVASRADGTLCALASQLTPRGGLIIDEVAGIYNPSRMLLDDTLLNYLPGGKGLQVRVRKRGKMWAIHAGPVRLKRVTRDCLG